MKKIVGITLALFFLSINSSYADLYLVRTGKCTFDVYDDMETSFGGDDKQIGTATQVGCSIILKPGEKEKMVSVSATSGLGEQLLRLDSDADLSKVRIINKEVRSTAPKRSGSNYFKADSGVLLY
ncbi:MAG: hypothetical protein KDD06_00465 [Phaeodactylibacter sp.]|nr:hypothetical protein [Phaeodactylibacter sp.]